MRKQFSLLLLLLNLLACRQNTANQNNPLSAQNDPEQTAIATTVHDFYRWYDVFLRDTSRTINFLDMKGKYPKLDRSKLDIYLSHLKAGGYISDEYIAAEKEFLRRCEPFWQSEGNDVPLTGLDYDRVFCAQDWDLEFWTTAPVMVNNTGDDRVVATLSGNDAGGPQAQQLELKNENGKWRIADILCSDEGVADFSGAYKSGDGACPLELTLTLTDGRYLYDIKSGKRKQSGKIEIGQSDGGIYLTFKNLLGSRPKTEIQGLIAGDKITIQNYGNSMNDYLRFKECDAKYIELEKYADSVVSPAAGTGTDRETVVKTENAAGTPARASKPRPKNILPVIAVNRNGEITLSGKKTTFETLKKDLQEALLKQPVIPDRLSIKSVGEVGMGTRQETQTLVNEAVAGAKWVRKKSAIATLNTPVSKKLAIPTQLQVNSYRTSGNFALIDARPLRTNGQPVDYEQTVYRDEFRTRKFADRVIGLLKYENGVWKVSIYTIGNNEVAASTWRKKYGAPGDLFKK